MKFITDPVTGLMYPETHIKPPKCRCKTNFSELERNNNQCNHCKKRITYDI